MIRRGSTLVTADMVDRLQVVGGLAEGGELAVSSRMLQILAVDKTRKSSAVKDTSEMRSARRRPRMALKVAITDWAGKHVQRS